jgi:hypothetical protein
LTPTAKNGAAKAASARIATQFIAAGAKLAEILEQSDQYRATMMIARAPRYRGAIWYALRTVAESPRTSHLSSSPTLPENTGATGAYSS